MVERLLLIVHDGLLFVEHPPLHRGLKGLQPETPYRASLLDDLIQSAGVSSSDAAAQHTALETVPGSAGSTRLVEDLQHLAAHVLKDLNL